MSTPPGTEIAPTPAGRERVRFPIEGMTCASCASRIGTGLRELDGVSDADVNLATNQASVLIDPDTVHLADLITRVQALGYDVPQLDRMHGDAATADRDSAGDGGGASDQDISDQIEERRQHRIGRRLVVAVVLTVPAVLISMVPFLMFTGWPWLAFALATPVVFYSGADFHRSALVNLRHRAATMDTLVSLGTLAAWTWSTVALVALGAGETTSMTSMTSVTPTHADMADMAAEATSAPHVYFETAAVIVTLVLLGKWFEARAKRRSGQALRSLARLAAKTARLVDGTEVPVGSLVVGDRFEVRPGERIATDGVVIEGRSAVDLSMITGEPVPVDVGPGDEVIGATLDVDGHLVVEATKVGADTALAQIVRLVAEAQGSRAPVQRLADRIASVFVPVVLVISLITLAGWLATGKGSSAAFTAAVAVLIIACPCALGLATPTAIMVGTGRAAQLGIIIKGGDVLEHTKQIDTVVLDKTGTLTEGRMEVVDVLVDSDGPTNRDTVLARAAALEARSEHPIARAIVAAADAAVPADSDSDSDDTHAASTPTAASAPLSTLGVFHNEAGRGVTATIDGRRTAVGRRSLFATVPPAIEDAATAAEAVGRTAVLVGWADGTGDLTAHGVVALADRSKATSAGAVELFHQLGLQVVLLTGDNSRAAKAIGTEVGVDRIAAELLPADKVDEIRGLQADGHIVAMVGDGINDAPALAQADLGIAVGTGTDVAIESGDLTIVSGDLRAVADALRLSRRTFATIKMNLFWAFAYNVAAIPLAAFGVLNPMIAAGTMGFSSVFVVSNSLRLRRFRSVRTT